MVRHRHNFDQFRFALDGDMTMGEGRRLREGHLGYFPEGTAYGPQADDPGPLAPVLQFGGASGFGYMSPEQYRAGRDALNLTGHFDEPVYIRKRANGTLKKTFSSNAIWEQEMGAKMLISAPRYDQAIFMNPTAFRWVPTAKSGVFRKLLGTFGEREVSAEMFLVNHGARLELGAGSAMKLLFVLEGKGRAGGEGIEAHCGVELSPDETAAIEATEELTLLGFTLPLIDAAWKATEAESFEPVPGEAVQEPV
jgi:hypothetical protein